MLDAHPKVIESAVIGIPDEDLGQQVKAFIRINADVNTSELEKYLEDNLAKFKVHHLGKLLIHHYQEMLQVKL